MSAIGPLATVPALAGGPAPGAPSPCPGITPPSRRGGPPRFVTDIVVELGFATRERVDRAIDDARASRRTPELVLLESGALTPDQLARATAERFGMDHVDLTIYKPDVAAAQLIRPQDARRLNAVPLGRDSRGALLVAMADPSNVLAIDDLKLMTGSEVRPVVAPAEDIASLVSKMTRLDDAVAEVAEDDPADDLPLVTDIRESAEDAPVIRLVNSIIAQAVEDGASDIHFEPAEREMRVRFRVDGVLAETATIPRRMVAGIVSRVKIMAELDIAERRVPQDGRVSRTIEGHAIDIRVVTLPSVHGERIVMRLLDKDQVLLTFDTLGMGDHPRERFERAFHKSYGAVLVTGPTGSGKSTTLYAALNSINSVDKNIITIEDPVEYQLPGISQVQVNARAGLSFARGLRAMLRADPDVIMVGEIRDTETARIAVESALTGHLVLSTLHTNDAPSAITRLTEMGIEPFLTASAVDCVVAQRLARTLCTHCKQRAVLSPEALRDAGFEAHGEVEAYEPAGCPRCGLTGYKGRIGLYEAMVVSEEIRRLALARESASVIRDAAVREGMTPLRQDGLDKVRAGLTSIAEVARVA